MTYALENRKEADRLHRQSMLKNYCIEEELSCLSLDFRPSDKILDAACGAGDLVSFLQEKYHLKYIEGCDASIDQINYCLKRFSEKKKKDFYQINLFSTQIPKKYNYIFNRFMAHHLSEEQYEICLRNFYQALRKEGKIIIIDGDGIFLNVGSINENLKEYFDLIEKNFLNDLFLARKIPELMKKIGFCNISYQIKSIDFQKEERQEEIKQWQERLTFASPLLERVLGVEKAKDFKKIFQNEIKKETVPLFFNKFIISGEKNQEEKNDLFL